MSLILQAYGIPSASPLQVSNELSALRVSHSIHGIALRTTVDRPTIKHTSHEQPYWVIIVHRVANIRKVQINRPCVLLVCDAYAQLQTCNVGVFPFTGLQDSLQQALVNATSHPVQGGWKLIQRSPTIDDYVNTATKPSYLNHLQSALYRILPYGLRKEVQALTIGYLAGVTSKSRLIEKLKSSFKLDELRTLLKDPKAGELREAVALFRKNNDLDLTVKETKFESFEILYVVNSSKKAIMEAAKKAVSAK